MAVVQLTVEPVKRIGPRGFEVSFRDSRGVSESVTFQSRREARDELHNLIDSEAVKRLLRAIVIARALRTTADADDADDLEAQVAKVITINLQAPQNIVRIV